MRIQRCYSEKTLRIQGGYSEDTVIVDMVTIRGEEE